MDSLVIFIPLIPLLTALIIGIAYLMGLLTHEKSETIAANLALCANGFSFASACFLVLAEALEQTKGYYSAGIWLESELFSLPLSFVTQGFRIKLAALFALLLFLTMRFSKHHLRGELGFFRFFCFANLFSSAVLLFTLSANLVVAFIGWELAGISAYLLIAYAYENPNAASNATRVFVTNRIGDAGFILGIALTFAWIGNVNWLELNQLAADLEPSDATVLALCFVSAAFAKSAQFPFTPWLSRSMEGPTASCGVLFGAILAHSGIFLVIVLQPLIEKSLIAMTILVSFGLFTAAYSYFIGLTQTDIRGSLSHAVSAQTGLMFVECGLGFWQLAAFHLSVHAIARYYQFLHSPGFIRQARHYPMPLLHPLPAKFRWAYMISLEGFWLDPLTDWALVNPTLHLSKDLGYFDTHIIDAAMGAPAPAMNALSSLAQLEEQKIGAQIDNKSDDFARGSGLAGNLATFSAWFLHWIEERLVIREANVPTQSHGRQFGHIANKIEQLLIRPRYLSIFVFITLLAAF